MNSNYRQTVIFFSVEKKTHLCSVLGTQRNNTLPKTRLGESVLFTSSTQHLSEKLIILRGKWLWGQWVLRPAPSDTDMYSKLELFKPRFFKNIKDMKPNGLIRHTKQH